QSVDALFLRFDERALVLLKEAIGGIFQRALSRQGKNHNGRAVRWRHLHLLRRIQNTPTLRRWELRLPHRLIEGVVLHESLSRIFADHKALDPLQVTFAIDFKVVLTKLRFPLLRQLRDSGIALLGRWVR